MGSLLKVIEDAHLTKAELEEQMEDMREELRNLEQEHQQVLLQQQICERPWLRGHLTCPTVSPSRTCESSTSRWLDETWTSPTLP